MHSRYTSWWEEPANIDQILMMAWELDAQYPDARIVAPGESFAWAVYATGVKRQLEGRAPDVSHVPFSGEIYTAMSDEFARVAVTQQDGSTHERLLPVYHEYKEDHSPDTVLDYSSTFLTSLDRSGNSPLDIVGQHRGYQKKTVFADKTVTGEGLVSFCMIMDRFAQRQGVRDEFRAATHYSARAMHPTFNPNNFTIENEGCLPASLSILSPCPGGNEFDRLNAITTDDSTSRGSSRFQPRLNFSNGAGRNITPMDNENLKLQIRMQIEMAVTECVENHDYALQRTQRPDPQNRYAIEYLPAPL